MRLSIVIDPVPIFDLQPCHELKSGLNNRKKNCPALPTAFSTGLLDMFQVAAAQAAHQKAITRWQQQYQQELDAWEALKAQAEAAVIAAAGGGIAGVFHTNSSLSADGTAASICGAISATAAVAGKAELTFAGGVESTSPADSQISHQVGSSEGLDMLDVSFSGAVKVVRPLLPLQNIREAAGEAPGPSSSRGGLRSWGGTPRTPGSVGEVTAMEGRSGSSSKSGNRSGEGSVAGGDNRSNSMRRISSSHNNGGRNSSSRPGTARCSSTTSNASRRGSVGEGVAPGLSAGTDTSGSGSCRGSANKLARSSSSSRNRPGSAAPAARSRPVSGTVRQGSRRRSAALDGSQQQAAEAEGSGSLEPSAATAAFSAGLPRPSPAPALPAMIEELEENAGVSEDEHEEPAEIAVVEQQLLINNISEPAFPLHQQDKQEQQQQVQMQETFADSCSWEDSQGSTVIKQQHAEATINKGVKKELPARVVRLSASEAVAVANVTVLEELQQEWQQQVVAVAEANAEAIAASTLAAAAAEAAVAEWEQLQQQWQQLKGEMETAALAAYETAVAAAQAENRRLAELHWEEVGLKAAREKEYEQVRAYRTPTIQ